MGRSDEEKERDRALSRAQAQAAQGPQVLADANGRACAKCAFYGALDTGAKQVGICQLYPPTVHFMNIPTPQGMMMQQSNMYPPMAPHEWCGQFEVANTEALNGSGN